MKLPIIASAIVALAIAVPSLASQAEGAGTPAETTESANPPVVETANQPAEHATAEEGKEEHHKGKAKKQRKGRKHRKQHHHHAGHHKDCDGKHAPSEPCNPGQFCPDK
jgi:hypothetical protein